MTTVGFELRISVQKPRIGINKRGVIQVQNYVSPNTKLPIFVYGALKPGEIAHGLIKDGVLSDQRLDLFGYQLLILDGLPRLVESDNQNHSVEGFLIWIKPEYYQVIEDFEPVKPGQDQIYKWIELETPNGTCNALMNSIKDATRSRHELRSRWSLVDDVLVTRVVPYLEAKFSNHSQSDIQNRASPSIEDDFAFLEMQASFLLLWSFFERLTLFLYGSAYKESWSETLKRIEKDERWVSAIQAANVDKQLRTRSHRNPNARSESIGGPFRVWLNARNNIAHRGKSAYKERTALRRKLRDMTETVKQFLLNEDPRIEKYWNDLT